MTCLAQSGEVCGVRSAGRAYTVARRWFRQVNHLPYLLIASPVSGHVLDDPLVPEGRRFLATGASPVVDCPKRPSPGGAALPIVMLPSMLRSGLVLVLAGVGGLRVRRRMFLHSAAGRFRQRLTVLGRLLCVGFSPGRLSACIWDEMGSLKEDTRGRALGPG